MVRSLKSYSQEREIILTQLDVATYGTLEITDEGSTFTPAPTKRQVFELRYANLLLQEMTAKSIARFQYGWECIAVRLVVRQRLAAQGFMPTKPRAHV